jgi:hypothetical protein
MVVGMKLERVDMFVGVIALTLLAILELTIVRGDQVGIGVQSFAPSSPISSRASLEITFDEPLNPSSTENQLIIEPAVAGKTAVADKAIVFQPTEPFQPGHVYKLTLLPGISATSGRTLKQPLQLDITVRNPRIVYWAFTVEGGDLYWIDPSQPDQPQKLTDSQSVSAQYDIAMDGSKIAYIEKNQDNVAEVMVWERTTGKSSMLYSCGDKACGNPVWRQDGKALAIEESDPQALAGGPRIAILDLVSGTKSPLFSDSQEFSQSAHWSPDGTKITVLSLSAGGIILHDFTNNLDGVIPYTLDNLGGFSPDGHFFPDENHCASSRTTSQPYYPGRSHDQPTQLSRLNSRYRGQQ